VNVAMATSASAPGRPNEDFVGAVPTAVVLLDGAGIPGTESICRHGVAWYTHRLGGELLGRLSPADGRDLTGILASAIDQVAGEHRLTCDIANPSSPQATVMILRVDGDHADYIALGDSFLVLDRADGVPQVITDEREVATRRLCSQPLDGVAQDTPEYDQAREAYIESLRARRNQPGGYWIAKDDPLAAAQAITGSAPVQDLAGAALFSNGASRIVEPYRLADWPGTLNLLRSRGPAEIIRCVRDAEAGRCAGSRHPATKVRDDATVAYCTAFWTDA
jgi:Protein phosphatase 2C